MEVSGDMANDLRDQRDMLIDKLSGIINTSVDYRTNNGVEECIVRINNQVLVDNISVNELTVETRAANKNDSDVDNLYDIKWKNGLAFNMYDDNMTGELRGYIDARDGNNSDVGYKGIPHYMEQLNNFARTFAMAINEGKHLDGTRIEGIESGHIDGYGQNDTTGNYLFSYRDTDGTPIGKSSGPLDYTKITAENFSLSAEVMDSQENISLSNEDGNTSNNEIAEQINLLRNNASVFKEGKIMDYMNAVMSEAAIDVNQAKRVTNSQANVLKTITNQRLSVSGVDINEEMMNLMKFQNAYSASAKVLQVLNEIYNITINGIGL
jgi:flagellar hook-associated protein 1 FlgK